MNDTYSGPERRQFERLDYVTPLDCKICNKKTVSKLLSGYTANISQAGLSCNIKEKVKKEDVLWLSFDRDTLDICAQMEKRALVYQNGIVGKVVRVLSENDGIWHVGVQFITREEKNSTHIYPKVWFLEKQYKK